MKTFFSGNIKNHYNVTPQKSLGQNFLRDRDLIQKIIDAFLKVYQEGAVLEVGPGLGALTKPLSHIFQDKLYGIEFDQTLANRLKEELLFHPDHLIHADALKLSPQSIFGDSPYNIVSNLPYNIAAALIAKWLETFHPCQNMILMVQNEVAQQLCAQPNQKNNRGRLTILTEYFCAQREYLFKIPPQVFFPKPKVDSALIYLKPFNPTPSLDRWDILKILVKQGFQSRRKTIANAFKPMGLNKKIFEDLGINSECRAEKLNLTEWIKLIDTI